MGAYDGAEICELVGLYLLDKLSHITGKLNTGLYRDDGLAFLRNASGPDTKKLRKKLIKLFKDNGLQITIDANLIETDFLDVTLNSNSGKYWPCRKPNNRPLYIHSKSNHPPSIKCQLPKMVEKRLADISCDQQEFQKAAPIYVEALKNSGFTDAIDYYNVKDKKKRPRKRNIVWFNSPFSHHVSTNIGRDFLKLLDKHFPPNHRLRKICKRSTIKISYSCMPNMEAIISRHNKRLTNHNVTEQQPTARTCFCRQKNDCPLNGRCLERSLAYSASVSCPGSNTMNYYGFCETDCKARYNNHSHTFRNEVKACATELSKCIIWKCKRNNLDFTINWYIVARTESRRSGVRNCNVCMSEKLTIIQSDPNAH